MKKYLIFYILLIIGLSSCGKQKEKKFEAYSPEAFAYSLPDGWEINATARVKGFEEKQENNSHNVKLSYSVDLITPEGKTEAGIFKDTHEEKNSEEFLDVQLDAQIELNSNYKAGNYKVIFNISDDLSGKKANITKEFELKKD